MISENDVRILAIAIALAGLKEYKADWLKNANTVVRDASGRFASKASDVKQAIAEKGSATATSAKELASLVKEGGEVGADVITNLVKNKDFRKRAGLESGMAMTKVIDRLTANPKVEAKIQAFSEDAAKQLRDVYGEDNTALEQALRKTKGQLPEGKNFKERLEKGVALSKAYSDALKDPEEYSKKKEVASKAAAAAIPIAVSLAIALGPEIAIPLAMTGSVELGEAVASAALGELLALGANKALDVAKVDNPVVRIGASLLAGSAAGGAIGTWKSFKEVEDILQSFDKELGEMSGLVAKFDKEAQQITKDCEQIGIERGERAVGEAKAGIRWFYEKTKSLTQEDASSLGQLIEITKAVKHGVKSRAEKLFGEVQGRGRFAISYDPYKAAENRAEDLDDLAREVESLIPSAVDLGEQLEKKLNKYPLFSYFLKGAPGKRKDVLNEVVSALKLRVMEVEAQKSKSIGKYLEKKKEYLKQVFDLAGTMEKDMLDLDDDIIDIFYDFRSTTEGAQNFSYEKALTDKATAERLQEAMKQRTSKFLETSKLDKSLDPEIKEMGEANVEMYYNEEIKRIKKRYEARKRSAAERKARMVSDAESGLSDFLSSQ